MENLKPDPIHILIADDHNMVRKGLAVLLEQYDDIKLIAEAVDGEHAVDICRTTCPNIILMDLNMPRMDGISATKMIRQNCPNTQIIILTSLVKDESVQTALEAGAIAYILKDATGDELANAIRRAHNGKTTLSPEATQALVSVTLAPPRLGHDLTNREREVLELMIEGLSNRKIGEKLVISSSTVKNHVSSILGKLDISTRTHAVALAIKKKILK